MSVRKPTVYASFDVETTGHNPTQHCMIQLGIALFNEESTDPVDTFQVNIQEIGSKTREERCMREFWDTENRPILLRNILASAIPAIDAMTLFANRFKEWNEKYNLIWIAAPCSFDWMFLLTYYEVYGPVDRIPLGYQCLCMSSMRRFFKIHHQLDQYKLYDLLTEEEKKLYPAHIALNDAIMQGIQFIRGYVQPKYKIILEEPENSNKKRKQED